MMGDWQVSDHAQHHGAAAHLVTKAAAAHVKEALVVAKHHVRERMEIATVDEHILVAVGETLLEVVEEEHQLAVAAHALHGKVANLREASLRVGGGAHTGQAQGVAAPPRRGC